MSSPFPRRPLLPATAPMRIETLGQPRLLVGDRAVGPEHEVVFAVVMVLLEAAPRPMPRQALCEVLWPDVTREKAGHNLRQAAYKLKQFGCALDAKGDDLALPAGIAWDVDERLAKEGAPTDLALKWGFLVGYEPRVSDAYALRIERWRERVHRRLIEPLMNGLRQTRTRTQWTRAVAYSQAILDMDPLNEEATLTLAEGRALQGSKAEAVALIDRYLEEIDGMPGELAIQPTLLKRRITERMPAAARNRADWKLLVGRDTLLESFVTHMRRARESAGTVLTMWGEPGVGKTRLVRELNALAAVQGWSLVTISCEPSWPDRPLCALEVMTSNMLLQPGALGVDPKAHRALQRLTRMDSENEPLPQGPGDSAYRQRLLRTSVLDLIDAVSSERPLLIAVDDAQWIDPTSVPFFSMAVEHAATRRVAWVFTAHQREQLPKFTTGGSRALVARVNPLTQGESLELLGALVHGQPPEDRPELLRRAASVSNGNPLYMHTLATHWLSTGDLSELPPSLEALIEQRLDTLSPTDMRCLQICAMLGRHATVGRVEAVLRFERSTLLDSLDTLHSAGLLETEGDAPRVRHAIIAMRSVSRASKAAAVMLHRYIADVLESDAREGSDAALLVACAEHSRAANQERRGIELIQGTVRQLLRAGSVEAASAVVTELNLAVENGSTSLAAIAERLALEIAYSQGDRRSVTALTDATNARSSGPLNELHRFSELLAIWAAQDADADSRGLVPRALKLVDEMSTDDPLLPEALTQGFTLADLALSRSTIASLTAHVERRCPHTIVLHEDWLRPRMLSVYYARNAQEALALAQRRLHENESAGQPYRASQAMNDYSLVARSFGGHDDLDPLMRRMVVRARECGDGDLLTRMVLARTHYLLDTNRAGLAAECFDGLGDLSRVEHRYSETFVANTAVRLMLVGVFDILEPTDTRLERFLFGPVPRNARSASMLVAARSGYWRRVEDEGRVRENAPTLFRLGTRMASWPRCDFVTAEAASVCRILYGRVRAERLLSRVLRLRFDTTPMTPELHNAVAALRP